MSEETNLSLTILPIFASLGSVPRRVEPTLENSVSEFAVIATCAVPSPEIGADGAGVVVSAGVPAAGLFTRVSERAVGPVVGPAASAPPDLELINTELVRGVRVGVIRVRVGASVAWEELLELGLVGEIGGFRRVGSGGGPAVEEFPGWDVYIAEGFFGEEMDITTHDEFLSLFSFLL